MSVEKKPKANSDLKRKDLYQANPLQIKYDESTNPRKDYGDEDFEELVENIRVNGLLVPISVYRDKETNELHLAHGFRRFRAIRRLLDEGVNIELIPVTIVKNNLEEILMQHITLNSGKPLSEIETAYTLWKINNLMGGANIKLLAERVGMNYQKVINLINYYDNSTTVNKEMVEKGEMSFTIGLAVAKQSNGTEDQNNLLNEAKAKMTNEKRKRVVPSDLSGKVKLLNTKNEFKTLRSVVDNLITQNVQTISVDALADVLERISKGEASIEELAKLTQRELA